MPKAPLRDDAGRRAGTELSVRRLQAVFPAHRSVHAGDGRPASPRAATGADHGNAAARGADAKSGCRSGARPKRRLLLRERKEVQEVLRATLLEIVYA